MIEAIIISLLVFAGCTASFIAGYKFGEKHGHTYMLGNDKPLGHFDSVGSMKRTEYKHDIENEPLIIRENHEAFGLHMDEPSGIIQRPSPEELKKMNEDEATRQAKEAMAETFSQEEEPRI